MSASTELAVAPPLLADDDHPATPQRDADSGGRRVRALGLILALSIMLSGLGIGLLAASLLAPQVVDKVTGELKVAVEKQVRAVLSPEQLPEIRLGGEGGMRELDLCDGAFTEMTGYRSDDVPPLYAAHNYCGGDIILGWDLGQRVRVSGSDVVYEVVEERHTPKWSQLDALRGMSGELMVQTCYYGENRMRFLALAAVEGPARDR